MTKALKVGLVGPTPPPNGGMAMQTLQLGRLLREEGVEVVPLASNPPYRPAIVGRIRGLRALVRLLPYMLDLWRLAGRVDVIHLMANSGWSWQLFAAPALWIARWRGCPVVVNYRGGEALSYFQRSIASVRPSLARATAVVVPSSYLQQVFSQFDVPTQVIANIVDSQRFHPSAQAVVSGESFSFIIARNLEPLYGIETAIQALAIARRENPRLRLQIAGSGAQLAELQALCTKLQLSEQVSFLGRLQHDEIAQCYRDADAMLNPTTVDNMPNSVLEALASGLPVLSTNVGGVPFIVEHEKTALLFPSGDAQVMAAAMLRISDQPQLRQDLARAGMESVRQYSWQCIGPLWLALYQRCAQKEQQ